MSAPTLGPLPDHGRFDYRPITRRPHYRWPNGAGLAVYLGFNLEHCAFGEGLGANLGQPSPRAATRSSAEGLPAGRFAFRAGPCRRGTRSTRGRAAAVTAA